MRLNNMQKIEKINDDRKKLLDKIKANLINGNTILYVNINTVLSEIDADEKNLNEYKALINAQDVIFNLIEEIANAKSIDDITIIRNKINYYINKIKKVLIKRHLRNDRIDDFNESTSYVRESVAKYIRYLKREKNIEEIMKLNNNANNLSKEEADRFRKLLYNEMRYNKRNINFNMGSVKSKKATSKVKKNIVEVTRQVTPAEEITVDLSKLDNYEKEKGVKSDLASELDALFSTKEEEHSDERGKIFDEWAKSFTPVVEAPLESRDESNLAATFITSLASDKNNEISNFLNKTPLISEIDNKDIDHTDQVQAISDRIALFEARYGIVEPIDYNQSVCGNMIKFLANIPRNIRNKKAIKVMLKDYATYYHGNDLLGYIKFNKDNNSISNSFKGILGNLLLFSREKQCLSNHQKCVEYVSSFCKNDRIRVKTI